MKKRTRVFLFVSTGILVLGLGTGLVASYMGGFQNLVLIGTDGPDELAYVPRDAQMVAYADVHTIATSALSQKMHETAQGKRPENTFEEHTGVNIERDVDHVLATATGSSDSTTQQPPLVLARGRFDAVRIEGAMREQGATVQDYRGTRLLALAAEKGHGDIALAFVEPNLVAFGPTALVRRAIDLKIDRTGSIKENAEVMGMIRDVKNGDTWAVARFDAIARRATLPPAIAGRLPAINWFSATTNVDDGVHGSIRAEARDDAAAQDLRDVVRGFMALARMQAGNKAGFGLLVDSLQLSGEGKDVTLSFSVPAEMFDQLAAMRAQHGVQGAPSTPATPAPPGPRPGA
ncbi:MAG TPA: hypothetical protein VG871_25020 [Vicinamibacterales bacterium]|nr:hypothetical protein [Vicinamibacterales bacterium]